MADFEDFKVVDADYLTRSHVNDAAIAALQAGELEGIRTGSTALDNRLTLIGLMADENNLAAKTVRQLGETPERLRFGARALMQTSVMLDESQPSSETQLPVAEEVRQLCRLAVDEAARLQPFTTIGPEHLLLAMVREDEHSAGRLLRQAGLTLERTRRALRVVLGWPSS